MRWSCHIKGGGTLPSEDNKETGSVEPCIRTKYRTRKFSDEALYEYVLKNPSVILKERAIFFSVKHQYIYTRLKALGITRKKKTFLYEKRDEKKRSESSERIENEKENIIVYIYE